MTHPSIAQAWGQDRAAIGGWVSAGGEFSVLQYRLAGYDYVGVDCQHAAVTETEVMRWLLWTDPAAPATIVRVSSNDASLIGKLSDGGADGIIVPAVNNAAEAAASVAATRYPPSGIRSYGPMRQDLRKLALQPLQARVDVYAMIETAEGLENVEQICATPGLRGIYVGALDLSIALGLDHAKSFSSGQLAGPLERIAQACRSAGVIWGMHLPNGKLARQWMARGVRLATVGTDSQAMFQGAASELHSAREAG